MCICMLCTAAVFIDFGVTTKRHEFSEPKQMTKILPAAFGRNRFHRVHTPRRRER